MKKALLFIVSATLLFSCKKSGGTSAGGGQTTSDNVVKKIIIHSSGQPEVDTILFMYDSQNRLSEYFESAVDTTDLSNYSFAAYNFIYSGNSKQANEYAYSDNTGYSTVDLLSYNSSGQLTEDSTVGNGFMQISYGNQLVVNSFYYNGAQVDYEDSLFLDPANNLNQWAEDTLTSSAFSREFVINYDTYTTNANPLYSLNSIVGILFEYGSAGLDPSFFYSKNLPSTESENGTQLTYQYIVNGSQVQQVTGTVPLNGTFTVNFYY